MTLIQQSKLSNKKRIVLHIVIPILITILSYLISISFIFKIPDGRGGYEAITYLFAFKLAFGVCCFVHYICNIICW